MQTMVDVVIIGGGPGGYAAALYCARANLTTLVLEKLSPGGQMGTTDQVDNYPGFAEGINGFELGLRMQRGAERFGVETRLTEVQSAELTGPIKRIHTSDGVYEARAVILATGASPRLLGVDGEERLRGHGVSYCATCDGMFYRDKTVAVIGGGDTAVMDALFLCKICKKVILVHRRDELRASKAYQQPLSACKNLEFAWQTKVVALEGEQSLTGLIVEDAAGGNRRTLACDGVFIAIGHTPNTALFSGQVELDRDGYIVADETTKTNLPGVFAVGDVRQKPLRQIVTAVADGAVASKFAEEYLLAPREK
nr:thioredoxin-disulfide reductase [bacterium]